MLELKPCPFCGGTNIQAVEGSTHRWGYLACNDCGGNRGDCRKADIALPASHDTNCTAFAADWNARTSAGQSLVQRGRVLPLPGSTEAAAMLDTLLAEYNYPANSGNAARAGWEAANRWLMHDAGVVVPDRERVFAVEAKAQEIYNGWKTMPGWVPWAEGGNSDRQNDARRIAAIGVQEKSNG